MDQINNFTGNLNNLVTIVMPVKNGELYVKDAIESINRQTINPAKVILADNNSTDRTIEIFQNNLKSSLKLEVYKSNKDIKSMNNFFRCIDKVETEYFCWLSHDDYFSDNWLEENLKVHFQNKDCITSFGECISVYENHERFYRTGINRNMHIPRAYKKGQLIKFLLERNLYHEIYEFGLHKTSLFKKALLSEEKVNKLSSISPGGDSCITLSLLSIGSLCNTQNTKFFKRDIYSSNGYKQSKTSVLYRIFVLELPWSYYVDITDWIVKTYKQRKIPTLLFLILTSRFQSFKKIILRLIKEIKNLKHNQFIFF